MEENLRANRQQPKLQSAKVDAIGYRLKEMKDLLLQRELRMEVQMAELNSKMQTLKTAAHSDDSPKLDVPTASDTKVVIACTLDPPLMLKTSPKTVTEAPKPLEMAKQSTRVHVCPPNFLSTVQLPTTLSHARIQDQGWIP